MLSNYILEHTKCILISFQNCVAYDICKYIKINQSFKSSTLLIFSLFLGRFSELTLKSRIAISSSIFTLHYIPNLTFTAIKTVDEKYVIILKAYSVCLLKDSLLSPKYHSQNGINKTIYNMYPKIKCLSVLK